MTRFVFISQRPDAVTGAHKRYERLMAYVVARDGCAVRFVAVNENESVTPDSAVQYMVIENRVLPRPVRLAWATARHWRTLRGLRGRSTVVVVFGETTLPAGLVAALLSGGKLSVGVRSNVLKRWRILNERIPFAPSRAVARLRCHVKRRVYAMIYRMADQVIVQTPQARTEFADAFGKCVREIAFVPNDVPEPVRSPTRADKVPKRILYLGGEGPIKGFDLLIEAIPRITRHAPTVEQLTIAGVDKDRVRECLAGGAEPAIRVSAIGRVSDVAGVMAEHDLLLVPSREDQCPNVVLEAASVGLPVIGADVDGIAYMLDDSRVLFPPSTDGLLGCLGDVCDAPGYAVAREVIFRVRERFRFDWEAHYVETLQQCDD